MLVGACLHLLCVGNITILIAYSSLQILVLISIAMDQYSLITNERVCHRLEVLHLHLVDLGWLCLLW